MEEVKLAEVGVMMVSIFFLLILLINKIKIILLATVFGIVSPVYTCKCIV